MLKKQKGLPRLAPASTQVADEAGFIHLGIFFAILASLITALVLYYNFRPKPAVKPNPKSVTSTTPASTAIEVPSTKPLSSVPGPQQIKKGDLNVLEKYCKEEASKLPEVPFTYKSKSGPTASGPMSWIDQFIPKDKKQSEKKSCTMIYWFDGRTAYRQMGAEYPGQGREFDRRVRAGLESKLDSSWKKVSGPSISNDAFNMVYKRENPQMGTVDFVDAFDGGLVIYVKFNTYYK